MADRPPTKSRRFLKLAGMTASAAGGLARARMAGLFRSVDDKAKIKARFHAAVGERIADTLGELKGAAMKVGQMASLASDLLPPELAEALESLQNEAPPMSYEVIAEQIEKELGAAPELLFRRFEEVPFAAASMGQVHRAVTDDGRRAVVKVQYPGVDAAVGSDLAQLKQALRLGGLAVDPAAMDAFFDELEERLSEELDYTIEAENARRFGELYRNHPWMVVPEIIPERSAQRVLTMEYEHGQSFQAVRGSWSLQDRSEVGRKLAEMTCSQLFEGGLIHGDPNPANYAFRKDGGLVLYDFGCVKQHDPETVDAIRDLLRAARDRDFAALDQSLLDLGARNPATELPDYEIYRFFLDLFRPLLEGNTPVEFAEADWNGPILEQVPMFLRYTSYFQPPAELTILNRVTKGQAEMLRALAAPVDLAPILYRWVDGTPPIADAPVEAVV